MLIENRKTHVYIVGATQFMVGVNHVTKVEWEKIKTHPHVKTKIEDEDLKVHAAEDAKDGVNTLKEFQPNAAEKLAKATFNEGLLNAWLEVEKRATVRMAIKEQLKLLDMGVSTESADAINILNS